MVERASYVITKFHLLFTGFKTVWKPRKHFILHSHNTETYCQCCKFLHSSSFYSSLFPLKQHKLNVVRVTSDSTTQRTFGNVPNWTCNRVFRKFHDLLSFVPPYECQNDPHDSCINFPIENIWPQWTKAILEILGWKHMDKSENCGPNIQPQTGCSKFILKPSK